MRLVVGLLTCLSLGALAPALANDPAPGGATAPAGPAAETAAPASGASTPTSSTPTPHDARPGSAQSAPSSQATTTGQTTPTAQATPGSPTGAAATTTAAAKSKTPDLTPAEKDLLAQGYKLEMRGTDKHFCRSEAELGTRFTHRVCITAEQAAATKRSSQDFLNDVQRPSGNTPNK